MGTYTKQTLIPFLFLLFSLAGGLAGALIVTTESPSRTNTELVVRVQKKKSDVLLPSGISVSTYMVRPDNEPHTYIARALLKTWEIKRSTFITFKSLVFLRSEVQRNHTLFIS